MNTPPKRPTPAEMGPMPTMEDLQQAAAAKLQQAAKPVKPSKAELQRFIQSNYRVEFNELTRDCELDGSPMGSLLHLADSFLAQQHGIEVTKQSASDSFEFVARSNPYNPVRRYLLGLRDRIDLQLISMNALGNAFGIHTADVVSQHLLAFHLAGAVRSGLKPGCKHDQLLVLAGLQGTGKSSAIEALAGWGWYDSATRIADLEGKDTLAKINSAWLFEIDECEHTLQKSTASEFKGFITRRNYNYVEKYEKQATSHPRRPVLFGTTNHTEFLNDNTGNRRVWIIPTEDRLLDPGWIAANRDSIWATVLTWIDWGLKNWLAPEHELAIAAAARAEQANLSDPWEGPIAAVLENCSTNSTGGIAQSDLIEKALNLPASQIGRDVQMRVTRIVNGSAFRTHGDTVRWEQCKRRYGGGASRSGYVPVSLGGPAAASDPTNPTSRPSDPTSTAGVGTAETPWLDRRLAAPFQPVPTFFFSEGSKREGGINTAPAPVSGVQPEVGTGWNAPETPCAANDLPVPTGSEQKRGWVGTQPSAVGVMRKEPDHGFGPALDKYLGRDAAAGQFGLGDKAHNQSVRQVS
jgi:predicted P-loop ATPase